MAALTDLQSRFQDRLLTGAGDIQQDLADGGPFMRVYEYAYVARQQEILAEQFPAVHALLGDERFAQVTADYVRANPPKARSARWIGDQLSSWFRDETAWNDQPVLADMAAFEWALGLAFDAPDDETLDIDALAKVPPDVWSALTFQMHPSLHTAVLGHDVAPFQQAVAREEVPAEFPAPLDTPTTWAVWRNPETLIVRYRALAESEARCLAVVLDGATFGELCERLADDDADNAVALAAGYLRTWIEAGWISGLATDGMSMPFSASD